MGGSCAVPGLPLPFVHPPPAGRPAQSLAGISALSCWRQSLSQKEGQAGRQAVGKALTYYESL